MSMIPIDILLDALRYFQHDRQSLKLARLVSRAMSSLGTSLLFRSIFLRPNTKSLERAMNIARCPKLACYVWDLVLLKEIVQQCDGMVDHMRICRRFHEPLPIDMECSTIDGSLQRYMGLIEAQRSFRALDELEVVRELVCLLPRLRGISLRQTGPSDHCNEDDYLKKLSYSYILKRKSARHDVKGRMPRGRQAPLDVDEGSETSAIHENSYLGPDRHEQTRAGRSDYCQWDFFRRTASFSLKTIFKLAANITLRSLRISLTTYWGLDVTRSLDAPSQLVLTYDLPHLQRLVLDLPDYGINDTSFRGPFTESKLQTLMAASRNVEDLHLHFRNAQFETQH